jgi:sialic acid synthase SpsE
MVNACRRPVILSTGMATMDEVDAALEVFTNCDVTLLHCTTEYPCPYDSVNLLAMLKLKDRFGRPVGYSDHTQGLEVPVAAVALGASVIEKHFTLSRDMEGPDHRASLEPAELKALVAAIRNVECSLGTGCKRPDPVELKNITVARKSIVAKRAIRKGEIFSEDNLTTMRPGIGISPMQWDNVIGAAAARDYAAGDLI